MNKNAAFKALKFVCLPTLALLLLLFFAFFSITEALNYITSSNGVAITLRIAAFLAEVIVFIVMYDKYRLEEVVKNAGANGIGERIDSSSYARHLFEEGHNSSNNQYRVHRTEDPSVIILSSKKPNS
jgi:hypothetical protein